MTVTTELQDNTMIITINRPEVRNAVDGVTAAALAQAFREFEDNQEAYVAILTGSNGFFCAGADLKAVAKSDGTSNRVKVDGDGPMGPTRMLLSKPVIAAIEGYAVAGGLELAVWCDLRVMAEDATFGVFCRRFGVPLVDGGTIRLPRLIGMSRAMDLILTGRPVKADEALSIGLANRVVASGQALEEAKKLAQQIAGFPQTCMRNDRISAYEQWPMDLDSALVNETERGLKAIKEGETVSGATRFTQGQGKHGEFE